MRIAKWTTVLALTILALFLVSTVSVFAQPRIMKEDVFTPLDQGFDFMRNGKYDAAENQFKIALSRDRFNPFALNNLAAIRSQEGKLKDAMAFLTDAGKYANDYKYKVSQVCFTAGLCTGVKPVKDMAANSAGSVFCINRFVFAKKRQTCGQTLGGDCFVGKVAWGNK